MTEHALRRLIDLPGIDALELKALMKPRLADPDFVADHPEVDEAVQTAFGLSLDQADAAVRPSDWPQDFADLDRRSPAQLVDIFASHGWDVTDKRRKPLRTLAVLALPLALAIHGVAGRLPFVAEPDHKETDWGSSLAADAARFRKR